MNSSYRPRSEMLPSDYENISGSVSIIPGSIPIDDSNMMVYPIIPPPPPRKNDGYESGTDFKASLNSLPSIKVVKNDYNQHFVDTGERPQNFIRDHEPNVRFTEYPKLGSLIRLKDELTRQRAHPPYHIRHDLKSFDWSSLGCLFDVVLIDPPWKEYFERALSLGSLISDDLTPWTVEDIASYIKVDQITETPSFCFIWCGSSHLDEGRALLQNWGFRRCEDICWCKTNVTSSKKGICYQTSDENGLFQRTKEHCLMGVKGVVRRSSDTHFIHSNIDTDVIVGEEPVDASGNPSESTIKPFELYEIIDRFCLGRRKLELFGLDHNIRPGWLTIGKNISVTNFKKDVYLSWVSDTCPNEKNPDVQNDSLVNDQKQYFYGRFIGSTPEIELLRPKSPSRTLFRNPASIQ